MALTTLYKTLTLALHSKEIRENAAESVNTVNHGDYLYRKQREVGTGTHATVHSCSVEGIYFTYAGQGGSASSQSNK